MPDAPAWTPFITMEISVATSRTQAAGRLLQRALTELDSNALYTCTSDTIEYKKVPTLFAPLLPYRAYACFICRVNKLNDELTDLKKAISILPAIQAPTCQALLPHTAAPYTLLITFTFILSNFSFTLRTYTMS